MNPALRQRFDAADQLLTEWVKAWSGAPFKSPRLEWEDDLPEVSRALRALSEPELRELEAHPARARRFLARYLPTVADRSARLEPDVLKTDAVVEVPDEGIPGRKREQIQAFVARIPWKDLPILEWCSGKGHLSRALSQATGQPARCIERDERLAHLGRTIAEEHELPVAFEVLDALSEAAGQALEPNQLACALHACGELHVRLLQLAAEKDVRALAVSPCCYHLFRGDRYAPLSGPAKASALDLDRDQVRLALQETVTASPGVQAKRMKLAQWRLGFDLLQREIRGVDEYLPVPSVSDRMLSAGFSAFVGWASRKKGLEVPGQIDLDHYEDAGWQRLGESRRLSVFRHLFRRPMEMWLVYDRALFLAENGYAVEVGVFCDRKITPRNILIRAAAS
ncbi:MAG: methyltransferase [Xanthomonadales bacterium]|nr:methyltransferase [Xanthomonadales bacterium]